MTKRSAVRRLFGVILLCSSLALIGAAPPPHPHASASPAPAPAATAFVNSDPTVIVYPFEASGAMQPNVGVAVAQIFSQQFETSGGLSVLPVGQGIKRDQYLNHARDLHADYYISGYLTPIGNGAAVVEQVVSVSSGIIITSQTAQIYSVPDVASQAQSARTVILAYAHPGTTDINNNDQKATPAPTSTNGSSVSIGGLGNIVNSLFKGGKGKNVAAAPAATPIVKPSRGVIIARVTGTASGGLLTTATDTLSRLMDTRFHTKLTNVATSADVAKSADSICGADRNNTIATGTLTTEKQGRNQQNVFTLNVYTCFGAQLYTTTQKDEKLSNAITTAVQAYVTDHPDNS